MHKFPVGSSVFYESGIAGTRNKYKVVQQFPVERDARIIYRIKSVTETFERTAEEHQLTRGD